MLPPSKKQDRGPDPSVVNTFGNDQRRPESDFVQIVTRDILIGQYDEAANTMADFYDKIRFINDNNFRSSLREEIAFTLQGNVSLKNYSEMYRRFRNYSAIIASFAQRFEPAIVKILINKLEAKTIFSLADEFRQEDFDINVVEGFETFMFEMKDFNDSLFKPARDYGGFLLGEGSKQRFVSKKNLSSQVHDMELGFKKMWLRDKHLPESNEPRVKRIVDRFESTKLWTDELSAQIRSLEIQKFMVMRDRFKDDVEQLWPEFRDDIATEDLGDHKIIANLVAEVYANELEEKMENEKNPTEARRNYWVERLKEIEEDVVDRLVASRHVMRQNEVFALDALEIRNQQALELQNRLALIEQRYNTRKAQALASLEAAIVMLHTGVLDQGALDRAHEIYDQRMEQIENNRIIATNIANDELSNPTNVIEEAIAARNNPALPEVGQVRHRPSFTE
jgi:hypothetical protein